MGSEIPHLFRMGALLALFPQVSCTIPSRSGGWTIALGRLFQRMDLVCFLYMLEHLSRVARVIKTPNNSAPQQMRWSTEGRLLS